MKFDERLVCRLSERKDGRGAEAAKPEPAARAGHPNDLSSVSRVLQSRRGDADQRGGSSRTGRAARRSNWRSSGALSISPADAARAIGTIEPNSPMAQAPAKIRARPSR